MFLFSLVIKELKSLSSNITYKSVKLISMPMFALIALTWPNPTNLEHLKFLGEKNSTHFREYPVLQIQSFPRLLLGIKNCFSLLSPWRHEPALAMPNPQGRHPASPLVTSLFMMIVNKPMDSLLFWFGMWMSLKCFNSLRDCFTLKLLR